MHRRTSLIAIVAWPLLSGCGPSSTDVVIETSGAAPLHAAMQNLTSVIVYDILNPPQASRVYTYSSIAAYEVLRHGDTTYRSLAGQINGLTPVPAPPNGVSLPLAGVHAFMQVGRALTFSRARMDSLIAVMHRDVRRRISDDQARRSLVYGDSVAQHILAWAAKDRFRESRGHPKYTVTTTPGRWVPTPPAYMDAVEPNWQMLRPFVLDSAAEFRPEPAFPFDTSANSPFGKEMREVYDVGRALTPEQRAIAAFWDGNPFVMHVQGHTMFATKKVTPGGHWMSIVRIASQKSGAGLLQVAETYALTAMAMADGFISAWEEKYRSNVIRPETVINMYVDEAWTPLLQTPPFPEYTSGHSVISTAAAQVLTHQFGDNFTFIDSSEVAYGATARSFTSFAQAAEEAALSRLYGGIHYRRAIEQGKIQGKRVGMKVIERARTRRETRVAAVSQ